MAIAAVVAACGGGGGSSSTVETHTPVPSVGSGQLDPSYGSAGVVVIPKSGVGLALGSAVDRAGNVVVADTGGLTKLDSNGARMTTFGQGGRVAMGLISAPLLDENGNIFVVSSDFVDLRRDSLVKLSADGQRDAAFASAAQSVIGSLLVSFPKRLARDSFGRLYLMAQRSQSDAATVVVARLDREGHLDPAFGAGGVREIVAPGSSANLIPQAIAVDGAGNVHVSGYSGPGFNVAFVFKLDDRGVLAETFGSQGFFFDNRCADAPGLAVGSEGNVYIGGQCTDRSAGVLKLTSRGALDASFGSDGLAARLFQEISGGGRVNALLVSADGGIYAAGRRVANPPLPCPSDFFIARLDASGHRVATFGNNGIFTMSVDEDVVTTLSRDDSQRLYLSGYAIGECTLGPPIPWPIVVMRLGA